jgi:hypothetical protein
MLYRLARSSRYRFYHVSLGSVDQLIGQTFEAVGQRCSLRQLHLPRLSDAAVTDQLDGCVATLMSWS